MKETNSSPSASVANPISNTPVQSTTIATADVARHVKVLDRQGNSLASLAKGPARLQATANAHALPAINDLTSRVNATIDAWVLNDASGAPAFNMVRIEPHAFACPVCLDQGNASVEETPDNQGDKLHKQLSVWTLEPAVAAKVAGYGCIVYLVLKKSSQDGGEEPLPVPPVGNRTTSTGRNRVPAEGTHLVLINSNYGVMSNPDTRMERVFDVLRDAVELAIKVEFDSNFALYRLLSDPHIFRGRKVK